MNIKTITSGQIAACPTMVMSPSHYREDGTCLHRKTIAGADVVFKPSRLARTRFTFPEVCKNLSDLEKLPESQDGFDVQDPNGAVAGVYLYVSNGKLWARGRRGSTVLRNPQNVQEFLQRSRRVKEITILYREGAE